MSHEIRAARRHADRLGCPDRDGRRYRAARRRVPPARHRKISGDPELRAVCQRPRLPGGLQGATGTRLTKAAPEVLQGSSNKYQVWELVDPEKWVPDGYACVRVDSRGAGRSPGFIDIWSPREAHDLYDLHRMGRHAKLVDRQGRHERHLLLRHQPVAGRRRCSPPHLAALCIWEGVFRLLPRAGAPRRHPLRFTDAWYQRQVVRVQHGVGRERAAQPR